MKRMSMSLAAALVSVAFGTAAYAADTTAPANSPNAGKKVQSPDKGNVQSEKPSTENMDSNAQRQHSRSTPSASPSAKSSAGRNAQTAQAGEVRDWNAIDKNKDHLISPDEMQAELDRGKKQ